MKTQTDYRKLIAEIDAVAQAKAINGRPLYLSDECVDDENVMERGNVVRYSDEYWTRMCSAAESQAGQQAEEYGLDINKALGYVIY